MVLLDPKISYPCIGYFDAQGSKNRINSVALRNIYPALFTVF